MAPDEHQRLEELFAAALALRTPQERTAFLEQACADNAELRSHIEALLDAHGRLGSFLDVPPIDTDATLLSPGSAEAMPTRIGRYRILQEIGEGGFGIVYLAEQEEPVRRKVALKIIKLGMDTRQVIARFEAERQALALMDHPNIARVLDAGATETGRPYFVMELVKGVTITEYCDANRLSTAERLALFLQVCEAVQHAHQKGIIHRDLKPNNVLVTLQGGQPVPKVIDFGIAKATSQRLTDKTLVTEFHQFIGTPEYMSPDQAEITALDVDTRTDIYSLGVLLYELLTGTTPFEARTLRKLPYEEVKRVIREVDPPRPSTRLRTLIQAGPGAQLAALRRSEPNTLCRTLRGDLDWIVMKAIEKDRTRRYATAKDLADDIERHLRHEPIEARPPSAGYKLRKFLRRHRLGVAAAVAVSLAVLTGLALATVGFVQATRAQAALVVQRDAAVRAQREAEAARAAEQRHRAAAEASARAARQEAAKSAAVSAFLQEMLASVDPSKALGRQVTVRYALDEAAGRIAGGALAAQPGVEAAVRMTLGETYQALGLYAAAEQQLRSARTTWAAQLGPEHPETLRASRALASALRALGRFSEAETLLRQTAETQQRVLGEEHPDTLATMSELALALAAAGRFAEAEDLHRRTLEIRQRVLGEEDIETLRSMCHLGMACRALGRLDEAEQLLRRALELARRVLGEDHPCAAEALNNLGLVLEDRGEHAQAQTLYRQSYEIDRRVLGPDHPETLLVMSNLLRVLHRQGRLAETRPLIVDRLAHLRRVAERPDAHALALNAYAWELLTCEFPDLRDPEAALPVARRAVALDGGRDANILETLALAYQMTGDLERAIETQRRAVARARAGGPYNRREVEARLIDLLLARGDLAGAAGTSLQSLAGRFGQSLFSDTAPGRSLVLRSQVLMDEGNFAAAGELLQGCLAIRQKTLPPGHWLIADTMSLLGDALLGQGRFAEAEQLLLDGYAGLTASHQTPHEREEAAVRRIVRLYESWNKPDEATKWRQRLEGTGAGTKAGGQSP